MSSIKIGFIGLGMVGKAIYDVLNETHDTCFYDIKIEGSKITDVLDSNIVFIAVPTIPDQNNRCDLSILNKVVEQLIGLEYKGVICIKSTITPSISL